MISDVQRTAPTLGWHKISRDRWPPRPTTRTALLAGAAPVNVVVIDIDISPATSSCSVRRPGHGAHNSTSPSETESHI